MRSLFMIASVKSKKGCYNTAFCSPSRRMLLLFAIASPHPLLSLPIALPAADKHAHVRISWYVHTDAGLLLSPWQ